MQLSRHHPRDLANLHWCLSSGLGENCRGYVLSHEGTHERSVFQAENQRDILVEYLVSHPTEVITSIIVSTMWRRRNTDQAIEHVNFDCLNEPIYWNPRR